MRQADRQPKVRSYRTKAATLLTDAVLIAAALTGAYLIRLDFHIWPEYRVQLVYSLPILVLVRISALYYLGGYRSLWQYTSLSDISRLFHGVVVGSLVLVVINYFRNYPLGVVIAVGFAGLVVAYRSLVLVRPGGRSLLLGVVVLGVLALGGGLIAFTVVSSAPVSMSDVPVIGTLTAQDFKNALAMPRAVVVLEGILTFLLISSARIAPRLVREVYGRHRSRGRRVLIYGAGDVGENLVRAMVHHGDLRFQPVGFVDDHPAKQRMSIHGVKVLGTRRDLAAILEQVDVQEVLIAITDLPMEDLLGRSEVDLDPERVVGYLRDRVILVTGAGGSIGSELCRQISRCEPTQLLLMGKGENSIYEIESELRALYPEQPIVCLIGDIGNQVAVEHLFATYRPEVVFHAAAHKHVPFMEDWPEEAVRNNVLGTRTVAQAALAHGVDRFVLISSDKAVHPSSVMGTTKKIAELILQQLAGRGVTKFITVRFGNVLRSRGSAVPKFERQIRAGGPVTVTHPDMTRYFMSIPEAVRLVLHSGAVGQSGDLCILDMGEPVRIATLAENMIRMAGKRPHEDIEIVYTGICPGEKLTEELFTETEIRALRKADKILICRAEGCDWDRFGEQLEQLKQAADAYLRDDVIALLREIVPGYETPESVPERTGVTESGADSRRE